MLEEKLQKASRNLSRIDFNMCYDGIRVNVYWLRAMFLAPGARILRHRHSSHEFHIVKSGSCRVILDGSEHTFSAGQMYITPPGVFHEQVSCSDDGYLEYGLHCEIKADSDIMPEQQEILEIYKNMEFAAIDDSKYIEHLFELIFEQAYNMELGYYSGIKHIICLIINAAAASLSDTGRPKVVYEEKNNLSNLRFKEIDKYILDNLSSAMKVSDISKYTYLSEKQIGRIIKARTGMGSKDYILSLLHQKAKHYLKYSEYSVGEIAERLGFSSSAYFCAFFEKLEGYTPSEFRKNTDT